MARWRDIKQNRVKKDEKILKKSLVSTPSSSLFSRFKAFLIDTFLITMPIFYIVIYLIMGSGDNFAQNRTLGWSIIFAIHIVAILIFWLKKAQTPGLKAYDLKLVDSNSNNKITFFQAILRYFATTFSIISIFFLFTPYFNRDKKTFQDIVSSTKIIDIK